MAIVAESCRIDERREIFAAIAMHGLASARPDAIEPEKLAREAVSLADALIKALGS